jgi:LDH2 family malate/lactate/ureidoglycolate dehydrogenase
METSDVARIPARATKALIADALAAAGLPQPDAARCAELMSEADLTGADGHGIFRLPQYVRRLKASGFNKRPNITVSRTAPATALVDGDNGMGHLVMSRAASEAIAMARQSGAAWVGMRRSNHAGPAGLCAEMPAAAGMVGPYAAVANANHMAAWGGADRRRAARLRHGDLDRRLWHREEIRAARPAHARGLVRRCRDGSLDHRSGKVRGRRAAADGRI